jgi:hypothetical protein
MNTTKLIKLSPMLLMIGLLAYACYSIHASASDPDAGPSALAKEVDSIVQELRAVGNSIATAPVGALRDPFQIVTKPVVAKADDDDEDEFVDEEPAGPATDVLGDIVRGLNLEGTFVQGSQQIAIIDGRIYSRGQRIVVGSDSGTRTTSKLVLVGVQPMKAVLHADGRNFELKYKDQIGSSLDKGKAAGAESTQDAMAEIDGGEAAMFKKLLNSPLGALGKSMLGNGAKSGGRRGSGTRSTRARSDQ